MKRLIKSNTSITAAKQVGDVSYCVENLAVLYDVIDSGIIWKSSNTEYRVDNGKKEYSISLSRNLIAPVKRNQKKWTCGLILDGNKLSEHYHITPYSYSDVNYKYEEASGFTITDIRAYDNNTYNIYVLNFGNLPIDKKTFEALKEGVENLSEEDKKKSGYEYIPAKRRIKGVMRTDYFHFRSKHGINIRKLVKDDSVLQYLFHHTRLNETEERIWTTTPIHISGCIKGIIVTKSDWEKIQNHVDRIYEDLDTLLTSELGEDYKVVTY